MIQFILGLWTGTAITIISLVTVHCLRTTRENEDTEQFITERSNHIRIVKNDRKMNIEQRRNQIKIVKE